MFWCFVILNTENFMPKIQGFVFIWGLHSVGFDNGGFDGHFVGFHGEGLSVKEGIKPVKEKGAQGEAEGDGCKVIFHGVIPLKIQ
jgi:hypothetical protein